MLRADNLALASELRRLASGGCKLSGQESVCTVTSVAERTKFYVGDMPQRETLETFDEESRKLEFGFRRDRDVGYLLRHDTGQGRCECRVLPPELRDDRSE